MNNKEDIMLKFYDDGKLRRGSLGRVVDYCTVNNVYLVEMTVWGYGAQKPSRHVFNMKNGRLEGYLSHYLDEEGIYQKLPVIEWACSERVHYDV